MGTFAIKDIHTVLESTADARNFSTALLAEGQAELANLLQSEPTPTEAMKDLRRLPRLKVRE